MPHLLPVPFSSPKTLQSCLDGWYVFSDIESILQLHTQMISQLEETFASSYICRAEAGSRTSAPAECHTSCDLETNARPWLPRPPPPPPHVLHVLAKGLSGDNIFMWKWDSHCWGSASYLFHFPPISHFFTPRSICISHPINLRPHVFMLRALLIPHPERAAALPQGCFHKKRCG